MEREIEGISMCLLGGCVLTKLVVSLALFYFGEAVVKYSQVY